MKTKITSTIITAFLLAASFVFGSQTGLAAEGGGQWRIEKTSRSDSILLKVSADTLPPDTTALEIALELPEDVKLEGIEPLFSNDDKSSPDCYFKQKTESGKSVITVSCVNKKVHVFPEGKPLFSLRFKKTGKITKDTLKITYAKFVDDMLRSQLWEENGIQFTEQTSGGQDTPGGDTPGGNTSGGDSGSATVSGDGQQTAEPKVAVKEKTDAKTGDTTKTLTLTDPKTESEFKVTARIDSKGKIKSLKGVYYPGKTEVEDTGGKVIMKPSNPSKEWEDALSKVMKEHGIEKDIPATFSIPAEYVTELLNKGYQATLDIIYVLPAFTKGNKEVSLGGVCLEKEILTLAKKNNKQIGVRIEQSGEEAYTWTFTKAALKKAKSIADMNLLLVQKASSTRWHLDCKDTQPLFVQARLTLSVPEEMKKKTSELIYCYGYDAGTKKPQELARKKGYKMNKAGQISLELTGLRDYVLYGSKKAEKSLISLYEQTSAPEAMTLSLKGTKKKTLKVNLPDCLLVKQSKKDILPGSSYGAAEITYASENKEIAVVDKNGKVTLKAKGKTRIATTVKLSDGTVMIFWTRILGK